MSRGNDFARVRRLRPSLSDVLEREILELIREEDLHPGDRLPTVRSLAEKLSVAAPTVREALRRLQASGVVEMRHGSGTYVRSSRERMVLVNPNHREVEAETILQLLETRLLIEPRAAELAAQNAGEAEIRGLEELLEEAEGYLSGNDEMLHAVNMRFHCEIAKCSRNEVLAQVLESLVDLYSFEQLAIMDFYDNRLKDHQEHRGIFEATKSKDSALARILMEQHLRGVSAVIEGRLAKDKE